MLITRVDELQFLVLWIVKKLHGDRCLHFLALTAAAAAAAATVSANGIFQESCE